MAPSMASCGSRQTRWRRGTITLMIDLVSPLLLVLVAPFVGSFLGLVITRLPEGLPLLFSRSRCDCGNRLLQFGDLVPVVSWALTRGSCRTCARPLSSFYSSVEV